jgi:hypothetical protein
MITSIELHGKRVAVQLSRAAMNAVKRRSAPLMAEIHLIFGCMVAKRVWFTEKLRPEAASVVDGLSICFRPVRYEKSCRLDGVDKGAVSPDYPIVGPKRRFVPDIVFIDHRAGTWRGDFTYDREAASQLLAELAARPPGSNDFAPAFPTSNV